MVTSFTGGNISGYNYTAPGATSPSLTFGLAQDSNAPVSITDNKTGDVVFQGTGPQAMKQAMAALSELDIDAPPGSYNYSLVVEPTKNDLGFYGTKPGEAVEVWNAKPSSGLFDMITGAVVPALGAVLGGPIGAAIGSAGVGTMQGKSFGDILKNAAIAAGATYLGGKIGVPGGVSDATISSNVNNAINTAYQAAQQGAASSLGSIYGGALGGVGSGVASGVISPLLSEGVSLAGEGLKSLPENLSAIQQASQDYLAGAGLGTGGAAVGGVAEAFPEEIFVTGIRNAAPNLASSAIAGAAPSLFDAIAQKYPSYTPPSSQTMDGTQTEYTPQPDEIVVTARPGLPANVGGTIGAIAPAVTPSPTGPSAIDGEEIIVTAKDNQFLLPGVGAALATGIGATAIPGAGAPSTPTTPGKSGVLGTGLSATELATLASLGVSGIGSLLGSGGKGGTTTPYVSPFGAGPAIGGADFRVNPNITDYERYGFGPEATFFRPEYNKLVASGSGMGGSPIGGTATTTTPAYTPLIGGGGSGTTGTTGATGTTTAGTTGTPGTTPSTPQVRPKGYTGVMPGQKVGDTQVVDGTTWVWGGFDKGWQMQYTNPQTKVTGVLPGNGATNVSSFANNPTVAVNQPYFAQNTANIPNWDETYRGFQQTLINRGITGDAKAAAERELFTALETKPFESAIDFVNYARGVSAKYPATTPAASAAAPMFTQVAPAPTKVVNEPKYQTSQGATTGGGMLGSILGGGATTTQSPLDIKPMVSNGPYTGGFILSAPGSNPDAMKLSNFNPMNALTGMGLLGSLQQDFNNATYVPRTDGTVRTALTQEELWGIMS